MPNADWAHTLSEVQTKLEQIAAAVGHTNEPVGSSVRACLDAFKHLRATAPSQLKIQEQTAHALLSALSELEKSRTDLATSNSLVYQIDMLKHKR